ncbi:MAG: SRPBCC domain-containing protein [Pseudomonadota bacterium]
MTTDVRFEGGSLIVTRVYAARIEDVFEAWIETSKVQQWWGCAECTKVKSDVEARVGGKYNHDMTIENEHGTFEVPGSSVITEYDPPHRLAYTSTDDADPMVVTVTFETVEGGTRVVMVQSNIPDIKVQGDVPLREIVQAGWLASLEKLDRVVSGQG